MVNVCVKAVCNPTKKRFLCVLGAFMFGVDAVFSLVCGNGFVMFCAIKVGNNTGVACFSDKFWGCSVGCLMFFVVTASAKTFSGVGLVSVVLYNVGISSAAATTIFDDDVLLYQMGVVVVDCSICGVLVLFWADALALVLRFWVGTLAVWAAIIAFSVVWVIG